MATQEEYELIVSIPKHYHDFKITKTDLPTTEGRLEHFLSENNLAVKDVRLVLVLLFVITILSTIGFFLLNHPAIAQMNSREVDLYLIERDSF